MKPNRFTNTFTTIGGTSYVNGYEVEQQYGYIGPKKYGLYGCPVVNPLAVRIGKSRLEPAVRVVGGQTIVAWTRGDPDPSLFPAVDVATRELKAQATVKWYQAVQNANANLALMFIERQQTVNMVVKRIMDLVKLRTNFLKRLSAKLKRSPRSVHKAWLEYRYGWLPTVNDIYTLLNQDIGHPHTRIVKSAADHRTYVSKPAFGLYIQRDIYVKVSVGGVLYARDPAMVTAQQYGLANPLAIAWELMPYSFVVDWCLDVGGYLGHLGALSGIDLVSPFTTVTTHGFLDQQENFKNIGQAFAGGNVKRISRTLGVPSYPNPLIPNNGLNLTRFVDAIALLRNAFSKR